jgi:hypothetical protein
MENKDMVNGNLGSVGKYDVSFKDGSLVAEMDASAGPLSMGVVVKLDAAKVLDALAAAIPGTLDDAVIGVAKAALLGK